MSSCMRADCRWIRPSSSADSASSGCASASVSAAAAIEAIGVRSSCETSATNVRRIASVRSSRVTSRSDADRGRPVALGQRHDAHLPDLIVAASRRSSGLSPVRRPSRISRRAPVAQDVVDDPPGGRRDPRSSRRSGR